MKASLRHKLDMLVDKYATLERALAEPDVTSDTDNYIALSRERAHLSSLVENYQRYLDTERRLAEAHELLADLDMRSLAEDEIEQLTPALAAIEKAIAIELLPTDPHDDSNIFLEIRAGTGGEEAALFAADLLRMYCRYADIKGWQVDMIHLSDSDQGGYKEAVVKIDGRGAYSRLKFESGAHRVQRVPDTESQGRIHTSTCTIAVLPEVQEIDHIDVNPNDLRIDTYRASGAGGQHVNKTDSAIRITHLPSGIVVECQEERSQHKNRAKAMSLLSAKLLSAQQQQQRQEQADTRKKLVGSGDRSERIRTYNFPQGRLTDHRINLTLYKLDAIMLGDLEELLNALANEHQAELLSAGDDDN